MRTNTFIASTPKIAIKTEDLITKGITLSFQPIMKGVSRFLNFPLLSSYTIDMVNSQKTPIDFATTGADSPAIGVKGIIGKLFSFPRHFLEQSLSMFNIMSTHNYLDSIRMRKAPFIGSFPIASFAKAGLMFMGKFREWLSFSAIPTSFHIFIIPHKWKYVNILYLGG